MFCIFLTVTNNLLSYASNYESSTSIICVQKTGEEFQNTHMFLLVLHGICFGGFILPRLLTVYWGHRKKSCVSTSSTYPSSCHAFTSGILPCISLRYSHSACMNVGSDNHEKTIWSDKCFGLVGTRPQEAGGETAVGRNRSSWVLSSPPWAFFAWL